MNVRAVKAHTIWPRRRGGDSIFRAQSRFPHQLRQRLRRGQEAVCRHHPKGLPAKAASRRLRHGIQRPHLCHDKADQPAYRPAPRQEISRSLGTNRQRATCVLHALIESLAQRACLIADLTQRTRRAGPLVSERLISPIDSANLQVSAPTCVPGGGSARMQEKQMPCKLNQHQRDTIPEHDLLSRPLRFS